MRKFPVFAILFFVILVLIVGVFFAIKFLTPQNAAISINTNPKATVYIDGVRIGVTPYDVTRKAGEIVVRLIPEVTDHPLTPFETKVTLISGIKTVIRREFGDTDDTSSGEIISFEKAAGNEVSLSVVSVPDSAQVSIDGASRGFAPIKTSTITAGQHQLSVTATGYTDRTLTIQTFQGYKLTALVKLAASPQPTASPTPLPEIKKTYVEILSTPTSFLRVRETASTSAKEVGQVKPGQKLLLIDVDAASGWFKVEYLPGKQGWVTNQYAKKVEETPSPSPSPTPAR